MTLQYRSIFVKGTKTHHRRAHSNNHRHHDTSSIRMWSLIRAEPTSTAWKGFWGRVLKLSWANYPAYRSVVQIVPHFCMQNNYTENISYIKSIPLHIVRIQHDASSFRTSLNHSAWVRHPMGPVRTFGPLGLDTGLRFGCLNVILKSWNVFGPRFVCLNVMLVSWIGSTPLNPKHSSVYAVSGVFFHRCGTSCAIAGMFVFASILAKHLRSVFSVKNLPNKNLIVFSCLCHFIWPGFF